MPSASNAKLYYEAGQDYQALTTLTDSGDATTFESSDTIWSNRDGYSPTVRRQGLVTGCVITPAASGTDNLIDISAGTAYIDGELKDIDADTDVTCARPAGSGDIYKVLSVTITNAGVIAVEEGTDGDAGISETRDDDGGPPLITVDSIEIGQVRFTSDSAAPVAASEIYQVPGTHQERYDFPTMEINYASSEAGVLQNAGVTFSSALPLCHDDGVGNPVPSEVWATYYSPLWAEIPNASEFVPAENSHSVSSKQVYGGTVGSSSSSLGQASFTAEMNTGIYEGFARFKDETLWFKFLPNRSNTTPYLLTQGKLGITRAYPAGDSINASCTISAESESVDVASE
jgi:hypothetical protein